MTDEHSTWEFSDGEYDPDFIYTKGPRGQTETLSARLDLTMLARIGEIVQHPATSFKTQTDFTRDAIYHRLHYWSENLAEVGLSMYLKAEARASRAEQLRLETEALRRYASTMSSGLDECREDEDWIGFVSLVHQAYEAIEDLRPPFDRRVREIADKAIGDLPEGWRHLLDDNLHEEHFGAKEAN